jgi:protease I
MTNELGGRKVALLATDGFEESELVEPRKALRDAGATVDIVSPKRGTLRAWRNRNWGGAVEVDRTLDEASVGEYDALVLPGGVMNPDKLRMNERAVSFVRDFVESGKPVAAICHGPWLLAEADVLRSRRVTSWPSLETDLRNAGADWVDETVVADGNLVTSRKPDDLPEFCKAVVGAVGAPAGPHEPGELRRQPMIPSERSHAR